MTTRTFYVHVEGWTLGEYRKVNETVQAADEEAKYALLSGIVGTAPKAGVTPPVIALEPTIAAGQIFETTRNGKIYSVTIEELLAYVSGRLAPASPGVAIELSTTVFASGVSTGAILAAITAPAGWTISAETTFGGRVGVDGRNLVAAQNLTADATGTVRLKASNPAGTEAVTKTFDVSVTGTVAPPADTTAPTITTTAAQTIAENVAFSVTLGASEAVTWSKSGGANASDFTLNASTGLLTLPAQDYETLPAGNKTKVVVVRATDAAGNSSEKTITVTIGDVAETVPDVTAPIITSATTGTVAENMVYAVMLKANEPVTYALRSGEDSALFTLNSATGILSLAARDFEDPKDTATGGSNTYIALLRATDAAGNTTDFSHTVTVTNVAEAALPSLSTLYPAIGEAITVSGGSGAIQFKTITRDTNGTGVLTDIAGATGDTYVPITADKGKGIAMTRGGVTVRCVGVVQDPLPTPVLYSLDTLSPSSGSVAGTNATLALNTDDKVQGAGAIEATATSTGTFGVDRTTADSVLPADVGTVVFYGRNKGANINGWTMQLFVGNTAGVVAHSAEVSYDPQGRVIAANVSEFSSIAALTAAGTFRVRANATQGNATAGGNKAVFDGIARKAQGRMTVIPRFDDSRVETYTVVFPLFKTLGLIGDCRLAVDRIGANGCLTWDMIAEMAAAGWSFSLGSRNDASWKDAAAYPDMASRLADWQFGKTALDAKGLLTRAANHLYWTSGSYQSDIADGFRAAGVETIAGTQSDVIHDRFGLTEGMRRNLTSMGSNFQTTAAQLIAHKEKAKTRGGTAMYHFHGWTDAGSSIDVRTSEATAWAQSVAADRDAGLCDVINMVHYSEKMDRAAWPI